MALPYTKEHYDSIFSAAGRDQTCYGDPSATPRAHARRVANAAWLYPGRSKP